MAKKDLAKVIRIARLRKGYSQSVLAKKTGVCRNSIISLEDPTSMIYPQELTLVNVCEALGLDYSEVLKVALYRSGNGATNGTTNATGSNDNGEGNAQ